MTQKEVINKVKLIMKEIVKLEDFILPNYNGKKINFKKIYTELDKLTDVIEDMLVDMNLSDIKIDKIINPEVKIYNYNRNELDVKKSIIKIYNYIVSLSKSVTAEDIGRYVTVMSGIILAIIPVIEAVAVL